MPEPEQAIIAMLERRERAQLRKSGKTMARGSLSRLELVVSRLGLRAFLIER